MQKIEDIVHKTFFGSLREEEEFQYNPSLIQLDWHGRTRLQLENLLMMVDVGYGWK